MNTKKSLITVAPLFLVLMIDGMGLGLLFPILNSIIINPKVNFLSASVSMQTRDVIYGVTIGIYMFCWFFGAAFLGDLSDKVGRKKALLICLLGAALGYFISVIAIMIKSIVVLIIGRMVAGFTAGSQPIAQAAIIDVSSPENKARNLAFILLAISIGFVLGPIAGGVFSDFEIVSWFNFTTPFYFAALLSLFNALLLWLFFHETFYRTEKIKLKLHRAIEVFISAFQHVKIRKLSVIFFVFIIGWSSYFTFISMYLLQKYHYSELVISLFLTDMALGFSFGCGFMVDFCTKRFSLKKSAVSGLVISMLTIVMTLIFNMEWVAWLMTFIIGIFIALAYSVMLTIFSNQVSNDEQGWVMGVTGAIMALCFGVTSFFIGFIAEFGATLPLLFAAIGLGLAALLLSYLYKENILVV